ncbi:PREDICTED: nucleolar protein 14 homolog [Dufourea novaeangliae]|uniref:Nucleolar protein 14 like protein n=1 Tax=Dufourea novaeangliae TaxID=178035 RepID=A0A154PJW4_DUFNO|nr:PREDICTED: nucleolar protein 14 homolog [Dufourea novaeangliae]XP_015434473.1 PREDICTED: nucleolar protein 14 homolog [Dufourea novaeangliae]KZC12171.1 Nucleolar protein 14 like protein [Dufourea novaeangliae]
MVKAKKKQLSELSQRKRNQQNKKSLNPFEVHINRDKQNVLGKRSKTDKGLPGVSRTKAIQKRKGTLLQEYKLKNKDNVFLDKRIGEKNVAMNEEDKAMARFAVERMKAHKKKNIYSLNNEEILTHRGQTLEEIEKFDDPKSDDEFSDNENKTGKLDNKFVGEAHFGGGILSKSESGKSRKDLIDELIAESKKRKAEKQKIREQTIDLTEKLDSEWRDLLPIVTAANKTIEEATNKSKADDYDIAVRTLKFEARGMPTDKLKSQEEIIKEDKEKLEALEADRLARMKGFVNDSNNAIKHKSADDLDDGFALETMTDKVDEGNASAKNMEEDSDNENNYVSDAKNSDASEIVDSQEIVQIDALQISSINKEERKVENAAEENSEKNSDEELSEPESSEEDLSDLKVSEFSSEEEESTSCKRSVSFAKNHESFVTEKRTSSFTKGKSILKSEPDTNITEVENKNKKQKIRDDLLKRKEIMEKARKELPYTYAAPQTYEELQKLLENHNAEYQSVIIDRIIKCNHWTLDGKNKEKLSNLFLFLLQHINDCAVEDDVNSVVDCFQIFDRLCPFVYDLAHMNSENAKMCIQEIIKEKHAEFEKHKKKYPNLDTLIFFKLVSLIFPTSDFRHPVVTPCLIFMTQCLLRCHVKNKADISKGLLICTLVLEYTVLSKRFSPSVINFLRGVIYVSTPKHSIQGIKIIPPFKTNGELSNLLVLDDDQTNLDIEPSNALMKAEDLLLGELTDEFKIRALLTAVNLMREFKNQLQELEAAYSIFEPTLKLLTANAFHEYPSTVKKHIKQLRKDLKELKKRKLEYIVLEKKKPKPLRLYEPRIEAVYDGKKHKTMSKEKAEREKLLHKYKKEMKGAVREIRRDRAFIAKVQIKQQIKGDEERKRKVKEIFGDAATQQSELKKLKRKK